MVKKELNTLLMALMFYTRIPVPRIKEYSASLLNRATRYFTLIGLIVGGFGALVLFGLEKIMPLELALIFSMVATILLTGAFHEDGFADFCDGFGGGYTKEKKLSIMKDSRIGTYGSLGLIFMLGTKFLSLSQIESLEIPILLIAGHAFSRLLPVFVIFTTEYVRDDQQSKAKPIGQKNHWSDLLFAIVFGTGFLYFIPWQIITVCIVLSAFLFIIFRTYLVKKIGGYTGDTLGALQQLAEVLFYLTYMVIIKSELIMNISLIK